MQFRARCLYFNHAITLYETWARLVDDKQVLCSVNTTRSVRFGKLSIPLPRSRVARLVLGSVLIAGGVFWFLPLLGLWMIPAGILVLSSDSSWVRRQWRKATVWVGRFLKPKQ